MGSIRQAALLIRSTASSLQIRRAAHLRFLRHHKAFPEFRYTTRSLVSHNATFCTSAETRTAKHVTGAVASEQRKSQSTRGARRGAKPPSTVSKLSAWFWRGIYTLIGAAAAGSAVLYVTDSSGTKQLVKDFRDDVDQKIRFFTEPSREKLLPDARPQYPGGPPMRTLVIALDETLVHSLYTRSNGWRVAKRPGAEAFLAYLCSFYEIVIFTSGLPSYADPILDRLDPNGYITHRLYRAETRYEKGVHVKDLTGLNRDLSRVVVIDHDMKKCKYQLDNAVEVPKWADDPADTTLLDLIPFLESLVKEDVLDVRENLAILHNKSIKDGIADYRANASARLEKEQARKGGIFFGASTAAPPPPPLEEDKAKGAAWNTLSKTSKLFHPSATVEVPQEAKDFQKRS